MVVGAALHEGSSRCLALLATPVEYRSNKRYAPSTAAGDGPGEGYCDGRIMNVGKMLRAVIKLDTNDKVGTAKGFVVGDQQARSSA